LEPRNSDERSITDTAVGGKKRKEEAGGGVFYPAARSSDITPGSSYSKASTAEDGLPQPGEVSMNSPG